jgi:RNA polymerase sigma-70 factor (ECF subfamily)
MCPATAGECHVGRDAAVRPLGGDVDEWGRDEAELVRRCREGSEAAYAALVRQHRPRLYALAYRLLLDREAAEDVVQETFLSAFRQIERFEPRPSIDAWLNTIVLRTASRAASRQRARPKSSIDASIAGAGVDDWGSDALALADPDPTADPQAAVEAADLRQAVGAAIAALPFKYRAAVVLRHVMGLDYAEAARALDIPLNTFKSHLLRGTKQLREALAAELEAPAGGTGPATATGIGQTTPRGAELATAAADGPGLAGTSAMTGAGDGPNGRHPGDIRTPAERRAAERTAGS